MSTYKCIFKLHRNCIVVSYCLELKKECSEIISLMFTEKFTKTYCSYCIKSIYAKSKKRMAEKEVFIAL